MNRYAHAPKVRTKADKLTDLLMFLSSARDTVFEAATLESLMKYGCDRKTTEYHWDMAKLRRTWK